MKIVFAGTPEFAAVALQALLTAGFEVPLVLTQPDRPSGRGMKLTPSAVKALALAHGIAVAQPRSLRLDGKYPEEAAAAQDFIRKAQADAMVVAAYGLILPQWVLDLPARGCLNIHGSLLPRWRGAAPIHRAIEAGDAQTGITIMQMDAGLDTGDMLLRQAVAIAPHDTTASLHDTLAALGGQMVVQALQQAQNGHLKPEKQPEEGITYAHKIDKAEALVDWSQSAAQIERKIRALNPAPAAATVLRGEPLKLWRSEIYSDKAPKDAGTWHISLINAAGIVVQCGAGQLLLTEVQKPGGKRISAADFARGAQLQVGERLGG